MKYLWARERVALLSDFRIARGGADEDGRRQITELGLKYNLLTEFTSFVAVDQRVRRKDGTYETVKQPLPMPQGVTDLAIGSAGSVGGVATQSVALAAPFAGDVARKSAVTPMAPPPPGRLFESRQDRAERPSIRVKVIENRLSGRAAGGSRPLEELLAGALSVADPGVTAALARGPRKAKITVDAAGRITRVELLDAAKPGDPADLALQIRRVLRTLTLAGSGGGYVILTVGGSI